jgi:hypothetical protein
MRMAWMLLMGLLVSACTTARRPVALVPGLEASWFKFPDELPAEGQVKVPSTLAAAIQIAVDDFVPWDLKLPRGADTFDECAAQQSSYDVRAVPGPDGIVFVSIALSPGACGRYRWVTDLGAVYAVDVRNHRVLAIKH